MSVIIPPVSTAESDAPCYLTVAEADALAEQLPASQTSHYTAAATDAIRLAALVAATAAIDVAMRYQGRKYAAGQVLEFPRVPYENGTTIWDRDVSGVVIVPRHVRVACLLQANAIADATRAAKLAKAEFVKRHKTGDLETEYQAGVTAGGSIGLCPESMRLLERYRLKTGAIR